jgi:ATP-dependent Clp protease ATP-binding subunit ClpA
MLDKATLTLGDNRKVDLSQTVIFLTSNLGGGEIAELMQGGMGFIQPTDKPITGLDEKVERTAVEAARRKFSPEFMNRLDKVVVFHSLKREQLQEVLDIELGQVQQRVLDTAKGQFLFRVTEAGRDFLLQEGTDQRYGARHLKRAIERHVVYPLANLLATDQVTLGDLVRIDWDESHKQLTFVREGEGALVQAASQGALGAGSAAAEAMDGKSAEPPTETAVEERKSRVAQPGGATAASPQGRKKQDR